MRTGDWYQNDQLELDTAIKQENDHNKQLRDAAKLYEESASMRRRQEAEQYGTFDLLNAAFSKENPVTSAIYAARDIAGTTNEPQEGYDVFTDLGDYSAFANQFVGVRNPKRAQAIKNGIDRQQRDNHILRVHGPVSGAIPMVAAGLADPLTLASLLMPASTTARLANVAGKVTAPSVIKEGAKSAVAGAAAMGATEVALHSSQSLRTVEESQINMAAGAILSGALGATAARLNPNYKALHAEVVQQLKEEPTAKGMQTIAEGLEEMGSKGVGADEATLVIGDTRSKSATGEKLKRSRLFEGRWNPLAAVVRLTPQGRLLTSPEKATRALTQELTDVNGAIYGDYTPTSVESLVRLNQSKSDALSIEYKNLQADANIEMDAFNDQVNAFLRYGETPESPQALAAAKKVQKLKDEIWDKAVKAELEGTYTTKIVDGVEIREPIKSTDAPNHFTRLYDQKILRENPSQSIDVLADAMKKRNVRDNAETLQEASDFARTNMPEQTAAAKTIDKLQPQKDELTFMKTDATKTLQSLNMQRKNRVKAGKPTDNIDKQIAKLKANREAYIKQLDELAEAKKVRAEFDKKLKAIEAKMHEPLDDLDYRAAANETYDKLINLKSGDNGGSVSINPIKGRTLRVDDVDVDTLLVKDIPTIMDSYNRSVGNKAEMAMRAGDGDYMWSEQIGRIEKLYGDKAKKLYDAGDKKAAAKVSSKGQREVQDLKKVRDRLLGLDQQPSFNDTPSRAVLSGLRTVRNWNTSTMLGGVMLSSLPEMSRQVAQQGVMAVMKGQKKAARDLGLRLQKLPKDELARFASASARTINNGKWATVGDAFNEPAQSTAEAVSRSVSEKLMELSGMMHFDTNMRMIQAHLMNSNMTEQVMKGKIDVAEFKRFGFADADLENVVKEIKQHGSKDADGLYSMNVDLWASRRMVEKMEAAVLKEANRITTSAGVADRPLFMSTELGKTVLQYRTFGLAAINRITVPLLQGDASQIAKGVVVPAVTAAGALMIRHALQGRDTLVPEAIFNGDFSDPEAAGYLMDVVNYAGWANIIPDGLLTVDKALDVGALSSTKYRNRDKWGLVLGPTAGTISAAFTAANAQVGGDSRVRAIRKLTPFQNLFYARGLINEVERAAATSMGGTGMYVD